MLRKQGRRRKVRRVFRQGALVAAGRRSHDDRQHVAGVRFDRARSSRSTIARSSICASPGRARRTHRAGRSVRESARPVPHRRDAGSAVHATSLELDLSTVEPNLAGPRRPQDRVAAARREAIVSASRWKNGRRRATRNGGGVARFLNEGGGGTATIAQTGKDVADGSVVIAAITSCTNTSNPSVMIGAGLLARNALARGLKTQPWVKTSLAPGSKVVTDYLAKADLQDSLDALGFNVVGYGCTTCIGNSGPLPPDVAETVADQDLIVAAVLSGNRNFEGRIHPQVRANYLASPPLVVAYALAGRMDLDLTTEPLGADQRGKPVYLQRYLAEQRRDRKDGRGVRQRRHVQIALLRRLRGRRQLGEAAGRAERTLRLGSEVASTSRSRRTSTTCRRSRRRLRDITRRARARRARRFGDDRSHLAGRKHRAHQSRPRSI